MNSCIRQGLLTNPMVSGKRAPPQQMDPMRRSRPGFSMVELMVVLAIIGIFAKLAMFQIGNYRDQTQLRQSAEQFQHLMSWAKLQAEKKSDTIFVKIAMPTISVYSDANGDGKWDANDSLLKQVTLDGSVKLSKPAAAPIEASGAALASGLANGPLDCTKTGVCCTGGTSGTSGWSDGVASICARTMPILSPLMEEGAIYLVSKNAKVPEMWAIVVNPKKSLEATLWTSDKNPTQPSDWRKIR